MARCSRGSGPGASQGGCSILGCVDGMDSYLWTHMVDVPTSYVHSSNHCSLLAWAIPVVLSIAQVPATTAALCLTMQRPRDALPAGVSQENFSCRSKMVVKLVDRRFFLPISAVFTMSIPVFPLGRGLFGPVLDGSTIDLNSVFRGYTPLIPVRRAVWQTPACQNDNGCSRCKDTEMHVHIMMMDVPPTTIYQPFPATCLLQVRTVSHYTEAQTRACRIVMMVHPLPTTTASKPALQCALFTSHHLALQMQVLRVASSSRAPAAGALETQGMPTPQT
jgi:hypothetical protein